METLYPIFYGTSLVTMDVLYRTFRPKMHPEAARRMFNFIEHQGGKFGIGGGWRSAQPVKPGFAPEGRSFHESQPFPSGSYYCAWDTVVVNPGHVHRSPVWSEVPVQGTQLAIDYGCHMNVGVPGGAGAEPWHMQPIELDGWAPWNNGGRPDLRTDYPIVLSAPRDPVPQPPLPPALPPTTEGVLVQFQSRVLVEGQVGPDVKFFQRQMNEIAGQGLLLDGYYGGKTTQAVKNWQGFFGLPVDGQLGPQTQQSIIEISLQKS